MKDVGSINLASEGLKLATCFRITRRDGQVFTFTDHDEDLVIDGETYSAGSGYMRTAAVQSGDLSVDNVTTEGILDSATITEHEMRTGVWDFAQVQMFVVDWSNVGLGKLHLKMGRMGEVSCDDTGRFSAELVGLTTYLAQMLGEVYTPECRANLGDARCKVDLAPWTFDGAVVSVVAQDEIITDIAQANSFFNNGVLQFLSGPNAGVKREVLSYSGNTFWAFGQFPYPITAGETLRAVAGCDHTRATCINRFNNIINYRGEPFVPGDDWLWQNAGEFTT